jgi:hypothetical protein
MATKEHRLIEVHYSRLIVMVDDDKVSGSGVFDTRELLHGFPYQVLATFVHIWEDGSTTPMFMLMAPEGKIVERACDRFRVHQVNWIDPRR